MTYLEYNISNWIIFVAYIVLNKFIKWIVKKQLVTQSVSEETHGLHYETNSGGLDSYTEHNAQAWFTLTKLEEKMG